jgi:integrase
VASISDDPNGRRRILFVGPDEKRKTIRLGKTDRKSADSICRHVEALLGSKMAGQPIPRDTAAWLAGIGGTLRDKLAAVGLVEAPKNAMLSEFLKNYILNRPDVKPATLKVWQQPCRNLTEFFGEDKPLRNITIGDADQFKAWLMTQNLAAATVAKRLSFARTFLSVARKHKLIDESPFSEVKIPTANVSARQRFIDRDTVDRLLAVANPTWKTIIALSRYGGLRCPSEVLSLEWRHVDWECGRLTVPSPKTDRYDGKESRTIPLFADLRPFLEEAFELAEPGQTHVIGGNYLTKANGPTGWLNCNLRTTFNRLVKRAGLESWPRLFHNMRSSRETELLEKFPVHVVAQWMGHDAKVCLKHYAQTTEDHFDRATSGAESGAREAQNPAQQPAAGNRRERKSSPESNDGEAVIASPCDSSQHAAQAFSGAEEIRTLDLCSAIAALYQLSYRPNRACMIESRRSVTRDSCHPFAYRSPIPHAHCNLKVAGGSGEAFPDTTSRDRHPSGP